jgi:thiamine biosynthesis lipoprotein
LEQQPAGTAVAVSAELFAVLERSQRLAAASGGAFDVTAGPIVRLWREVRRTGQPPTDRDRADALRRTGYTKLELNPVHRTVTLRAAGMQFDLGGIAKGYAADEALAVLARLGLPHAMVAAGGDLALGDAPPGTAGWKVELAPFGRSASDALTVVVANAGVSTSGDVEQFVEIAGTRYSHVVDPRTALGLTAPIAVTIIAPEATLADGLATACSVLAAGADEQLAACLDPAARAILHRRGPDGRVRRETIGAGPPGLRSIL